MRLPTIETIKAGLNVDAPVAARIHAALVTCDDNPDVRAALTRVDAILDGHDVDYIRSAQDTMREPKGVEYVNIGDTYAPTVMFDYARDAFLVGTWGDTVEKFPARFTE